MAKSDAPLTADTVEDEVQYSVKMAKTIPYGNVTLRRNSTATLKGRVIKQLGDSIGAISPIAA